MKPENNNDALLKDVFGEAAPPGFRDSMLGESVRTVRRRRTARRVGRAGALLVALGLVAVLWRQGNVRKREVASKATPPKIEQSYTLVRNQSLPPSAIITTQPFSSAQVIDVTTFAGIIRTRPNSFRPINDDELLSFLAARPCALVRVGPDSEKLVFVNPDDAKGFPLN